ncbi:hypothetical protein B0T25DRAFT_622595 [Lasiosphaeria hispida]|uniref:Calcineurin-like phosphoesterase domain-containing protein n=1 Tax=Lasiosphaeria hispida TaxID=260671 RepID=A0AAJ0MGQ5_9PEZI|nr:hypothetical protein B0T25DRAFT_622595 [Lasiosphaeria hispida]
MQDIKTRFLILSDTRAGKELIVPTTPVDVAIHCGDLTSIHHFDLRNGAKLTVYANPFTPSPEADGGFQFKRAEQHNFHIDKTVDIVITHGPPKGVLDMTSSRQRAGCEDLFAAVAKACPRLHCFGHIHEGWRAKLVGWRDAPSEHPSHFTDIRNEASAVIETLATIRAGKRDTPDLISENQNRSRTLMMHGYRATSHCANDKRPIRPGVTTLFVNAAIQPEDHEEEAQVP